MTNRLIYIVFTYLLTLFCLYAQADNTSLGYELPAGNVLQPINIHINGPNDSQNPQPSVLPIKDNTTTQTPIVNQVIPTNNNPNPTRRVSNLSPDQIIAIKTRLQTFGLPISNTDPVFDDELEQALRQYQSIFGLNVTGQADKYLWNSFFLKDTQYNYLEQEREKELNRLKNQITRLGFPNKYIVVNIPSFTLELYGKDNTNREYISLLRSRVIVGKPSTPTPMDSFYIRSLKYNPNWTPTANMLKHSRKSTGEYNKHWIRHHGLIAYDETGTAVDLDMLDPNESYHFSQPSGNRNALGRLKFETTSTQNIYLHDTNAKNLFSRDKRAYSSGCVRVQKYNQLAQLLLNKESVRRGLSQKKTYYDQLPKRVPVIFTYIRLISTGNMFYIAPDVYHKDHGRGG